MKILSSFDTKYKRKLLREKKIELGEKNVHLIEKSHLFLLRYIYIPIIVSIIVGIIVGLLVYHLLKTSIITSIIVTSIIIILMIIPYNIERKIIDYHMDFCIITPHDIILAEQTGFFKRNIRTLDVHKIKSISVYKEQFRKSIFNNGNIVFMSDGNEDDLGEISIDYVYNPEQHRKSINIIINSQDV